jgi:hypothetical protein
MFRRALFPLEKRSGFLKMSRPLTAAAPSRPICLENGRTMRILGIILICIGLLTLALPYLTFTKREKVLDIGPVEAVAEKRERIPVSPVLGAVILVAGAGIVIASARKKGST